MRLGFIFQLMDEILGRFFDWSGDVRVVNWTAYCQWQIIIYEFPNPRFGTHAFIPAITWPMFLSPCCSGNWCKRDSAEVLASSDTLGLWRVLLFRCLLSIDLAMLKGNRPRTLSTQQQHVPDPSPVATLVLPNAFRQRIWLHRTRWGWKWLCV